MRKTFKLAKAALFILLGLFITVGLLIGGSILHYFTMKPVSPSTFYFKDVLGNLYYDSTTGCLDVCLMRSYGKLGADKKSFQVLGVSNPFRIGDRFIGDRFIESRYAKDKRSVFWLDRRITEADPASFTAISYDLGKDANQYFLHETSLVDYLTKEFSESSRFKQNSIEVLSYQPSRHLVLYTDSKYYFVKLNPQPKEIREISRSELQKYSKL